MTEPAGTVLPLTMPTVVTTGITVAVSVSDSPGASDAIVPTVKSSPA